MPAVGEDGELDPLRAAVVEERVDRGADGAAGEEDVVDEDDRPALEVEVEVRGVDDRGVGRRAAADVVAVEGDVDVAERELGREQLLEMGVEAAGEDRAAGVDPDDRDGGAAVIGIVVAAESRRSSR